MDKDVVHMYNGILLSHQKEWNNAICSNIDRPRDCHTEWIKSDREREILCDTPYIQNLKINDTNELTYKTKIDPQAYKMNLWLPGGKDWWGGIVREFGIDMYLLLYLGWMDNKDLWYSMGNSVQCYVVPWMGGGVWKIMDMAESLCCLPETIIVLLWYKVKIFKSITRI